MIKDIIPRQPIVMLKTTLILLILTPDIKGINRRIIEMKIVSRGAIGVVKQGTSKLVAEQDYTTVEQQG
jgi:hypothetical protein